MTLGVSYKDVTEYVEFGSVDDESLPLTKCVCGKKFDSWHHILGIESDEEYAKECPECGRKLFFRNSVHVYELIK